MRAAILAFISVIALSTASAQDIVLGQIVDLKGDLADSCHDFNAGAQTYFDMINAKGGLNGDHIVMATREAGADHFDPVAVSRELVDKAGAVALFGYCGGTSSMRVVESSWFKTGNVPMLAPFSGSDALRGSNVGPVYHVRAGNNEEAQKLVKTLKGFGMTRVMLIMTGDEIGQAGGRAYLSALKDAGIAPLAQAVLQPGGENAPAILNKVDDLRAQAILLAAPTIPAAILVNELRNGASGAMIFSLSEVNHTTLNDYLGSSTAAQGIVIATLMPSTYFATTPLAREHIKEMKLFRDEPPSQATLEGYVAAKIAVEALRRAGRKISAPEMLSALSHLGTIDLGGYSVRMARGQSGSTYVDASVVSKSGQLLK